MGFEGNIWRWEASEATDQYVNYFFCSIQRMQQQFKATAERVSKAIATTEGRETTGTWAGEWLQEQ